MSLTDRQARFVDEYIVDLNAKQAAIRSGYSKKTAEVQGSRLLSNAKVADAIAKRQKERGERTQLTADRVIKELGRIALGDIRSLFDERGNLRRPSELSADEAAMLSSVEVVTRSIGDGQIEYVHKLKAWDKVSALDKLMRHLGEYAADKHEVTGKNGGPIELSDTERAAKLSALLERARKRANDEQ